MNEELKKRILELPKKNLNILDLGCGITQFEYYSLFMQFRTNDRLFNYIGVDIEDEFNIFCWGRERFDYSPSELMNRSFNDYFSEDFTGGFNLNTIQKHFKFNPNTNIIDYIKTLAAESYFDVIVLSNILHKIDKSDANCVFNKCLEHLEDDGLIYISVLGEKYKNLLQEDKPFSGERYNIMKGKVNVVWSNNESGKDSLQFMGTLKTKQIKTTRTEECQCINN